MKALAYARLPKAGGRQGTEGNFANPIEMATASTQFEPAPIPVRAAFLFARLTEGDEIAHLITLVLRLQHSADHRAAGLSACGSIPRWPATSSAGSFSYTSTWDPVSGDFGALPFIYGTLVTSALALIIAVPLGLGAAIFLAELGPAQNFRFAGISDRSAGGGSQRDLRPAGHFHAGAVDADGDRARSSSPLWDSSRSFRGPSYGVGLLTAGMVLAIMIVPFIISVSREVLLAVPSDQREAALRSAPRAGKPPGRWWCPSPAPASSAPSFWRWPAPWAKPWPSPWSSATIRSIAASLFAPGYSIAAVIANEFTEATGNLYLSA